MTPYQYAGNNPGMLNDPMGDLYDLQREAFMQEEAERHAIAAARSRYDWREASMEGSDNAWDQASYAAFSGSGGMDPGVAAQIAMGNGYSLNGNPFAISNFINVLNHGGMINTSSVNGGIMMNYHPTGSTALTAEEQAAFPTASPNATNVGNYSIFIPQNYYNNDGQIYNGFREGGNKYIDGLTDGNGALDSFMGAMKSRSGLTQIGSNTILYFPRESGRVFRGSQYVNTYSLSNTGATFAKYTARLGVALSVAQIGYGVYQDGGQYGYNAKVATGSAVGGAIGGWVGAEAGGAAGAITGGAIGVWFFGVGAVPGAAIGGVIGGVAGGMGGGWYGGKLVSDQVKNYYGH